MYRIKVQWNKEFIEGKSKSNSRRSRRKKDNIKVHKVGVDCKLSIRPYDPFAIETDSRTSDEHYDYGYDDDSYGGYENSDYEKSHNEYTENDSNTQDDSDEYTYLDNNY